MYDKFKKILSNAPDEQTFKTAYNDISNLKQLRNSLITIGKPFYDQFINKEENHFANWIENVFEDSELALELRETKSYGKTVKLLDNRIKYLELWLVFNGDKEVLTKYLVNGPISLRRLMQAELFEPNHHNYETVQEYNKKHTRESTGQTETPSYEAKNFFQKLFKN
jgi:hypothetical protein